MGSGSSGAVGLRRRARFLRSLSSFIVFACFACALVGGQEEEQLRSVGVFVALADNKHQGIVPVPERIGNGNDPENNLYWGTADGLKGCFDRSDAWTLVSYSEDPPGDKVLQSRTYRDKATGAVLDAFAYRGDSIRVCIEAFETAVRLGSYDLAVFIGHNGLMDFRLPRKSGKERKKQPADCIVLCCMSEKYFRCRLAEQGGRPILMTQQLMYPGSFILHAVVDDWLAGASLAKIRQEAAEAYAANQGISEKAALGVFSDLQGS